MRPFWWAIRIRLKRRYRTLKKQGSIWTVCRWCDAETLQATGFGYTECLRCGRILQRWYEPWISYIEFVDGCVVQAETLGTGVLQRSAKHDQQPNHEVMRRWDRPIPIKGVSTSTVSISEAP